MYKFAVTEIIINILDCVECHNPGSFLVCLLVIFRVLYHKPTKKCVTILESPWYIIAFHLAHFLKNINSQLEPFRRKAFYLI